MTFAERLIAYEDSLNDTDDAIADYLRQHRGELERLSIQKLAAALYTVPNTLVRFAKKLHYTEQLPGALFSGVSWMLFSYIFSFYISLSNRFGAYGYIGTIMVAMMWLFYCFYFLLIGGYINYLLEQRRARREKRADYEAGKQRKNRKQG